MYRLCSIKTKQNKKNLSVTHLSVNCKPASIQIYENNPTIQPLFKCMLFFFGAKEHFIPEFSI